MDDHIIAQSTEEGDPPQSSRKRSRSRKTETSDPTKKPETIVLAAGCNAWNNLVFPDSWRDCVNDPQDITSFKVVWEGETVSGIESYLTWTIAHLDGSQDVFGEAPFGTNGLREYLKGTTPNGAGEVLVRNLTKVPSTFHQNTYERYKLENALSWQPRLCLSKTRSTGRPIEHVAAWRTGFIIMDDCKRVYTVGDKRYQACLGRSHDDEYFRNELYVTGELSPDFIDISGFMDNAFLVTDLPAPTEKTLKVVAGGYTVGVLTVWGHLYAWGMQTPGSKHTEKQALSGLSGLPNYQSVGDDENIADVAFGDFHAIALTWEGDVYVIGGNKSGQLGLNSRERADTWTKVHLDLGDYRVEEVVAGPQTSFLIARLAEDSKSETMDVE